MSKSHGDNIKNLYLDFDGCIVNSIEAIVSLYNEDFRYYKKFVPVHWTDIHSWNFTECNCAKTEYINAYFNQPRFFERVKFMDWAKEVIEELKNEYNITIVSHGHPPNLKAKEEWSKENLPFCGFIGVDMKKYEDKSSIDMSDGIFIDDSVKTLSQVMQKLMCALVISTHGMRVGTDLDVLIGWMLNVFLKGDNQK